MDITTAIRKLNKEWDRKGFSPMAINCGHCSFYAESLKKLFPQGKIVWGIDIPHSFQTNVCPVGHCFFALNGRYYDSESPRGVIRPDDLKYYKRIPKHGGWRPYKYA